MTGACCENISNAVRLASTQLPAVLLRILLGEQTTSGSRPCMPLRAIVIKEALQWSSPLQLQPQTCPQAKRIFRCW